MTQRLLLIALLGLAALGACSRDPGDPEFDNPFDPNGTDPGSGYGLTVVARGDSVVMTWDNVGGVQAYQVYWSSASSAFEDMARITSPENPVLPPANTPRVEYSHRNFTAERTNWYRIVGITSYTSDSGLPIEASMTPSQPVAVDISVLVLPVGAITTTPTRFIQLDLLTGGADSVEISNARDFAGSTVFGVVPGESSRVDWALPEVDEDREDLWVHFRTRSAPAVGAPDSFAIQARFDPSLLVESGLRLDTTARTRVMVDTLIVLGIAPLPGQTLVRVVRERAIGDTGDFEEIDITPPSITDPVEVHWDPAVEPLEDGRVRAVLRSDFGFADSASVDLVIPELLGAPAIAIVGGSVTTSRDLRIACTARNAGHVFFSEAPDFSTGTWVNFADTLSFQLSDTLGSRFLYAAFSNPVLAETAVSSTPVTLVVPPAPARR